MGAMEAANRRVYFDGSGDSIPRCPSCGAGKKKVRYWYEDIVLAVLHWPSLAECTGCGWAYQDERFDA